MTERQQAVKEFQAKMMTLPCAGYHLYVDMPVICSLCEAIHPWILMHDSRQTHRKQVCQKCHDAGQ